MKYFRMINGNELNLVLCEGRHNITQAQNGSIFGAEISEKLLKNPELLEKVAFSRIWNKAYEHGFVRHFHAPDDEDALVIHNVHINLYVTGLTIALISVINAMRGEDVTITLYHYDRDTGEYYPQEVM